MRLALYGALAVLAALLLLGTLADIRSDWRVYRTADAAAQLRAVSEDLLKTKQQVVLERTGVLRQLFAGSSGENLAAREIQGARQLMARRFDAALARLARLDASHSETLSPRLAALKESRAALDAVRADVDRELATPGPDRPADLAVRWFAVSGQFATRSLDLLAALNEAVLDLGGTRTRFDAVVTDGLMFRAAIAQDIWSAIEAAYGFGAPSVLAVGPANGTAAMTVLWEQLRQAVAVSDDPLLSAALHRVQSTYFVDYAAARAAIRDGSPGRVAPADAGRLMDAGARSLNAGLEILTVAVAARNREAEQVKWQAIRGLAGSVLVFTVSLAVVGAVAVFVHFQVLLPLSRLTRTMRALAAGDLTVDVPALPRAGEIAAMAETVKVFRTNAIRLEIDAKEKRRAENLLTAERRILEMTAQRTPLTDVLGAICAGTQEQIEGAACCIILLDPDGMTMRTGVAPNLPPEVPAAYEGAHIGLGIGSGAAAIYLRRPVFSHEITRDPLWARFPVPDVIRDFHACWSLPIMTAENEALGALSIFFRESREPDARDIDLARRASQLAAIVIGNKRAESQLEQAKAAAELGSRTKSEFLANMSHELRTPLNAIIGFAEVLDADLAAHRATLSSAGYAQDIIASGRHLLNLINDILDVSKIEAGRVELRERICDVADLLAGCERMVRARALERRLDLTVKPHEGVPPVLMDDVKFKQIVLNLLSNAIKFTSPGGSVTLEAKADPARGLIVTVTDTGIGIRPEDLQKVFVPFHQVDNIYARINPGTGLGLALSKGLAELHGGKLTIDSVFGEGTTVTLTLPPSRLLISDFAESRAMS